MAKEKADNLEPLRYPDDHKEPELRGKYRNPHLRRIEAAEKLLERCGIDPADLPWRYVGGKYMGQAQVLYTRGGRRLGMGVWGNYNYALYLDKLERAREKNARRRADNGE